MLHRKTGNKVGKKRTTIHHHSNFDRTLCSGIMNNAQKNMRFVRHAYGVHLN